MICFEYSFRTVTYHSAVWVVSQSELYFLKRHTCACACGTIIFRGMRQRLRRKNFRVVARALAAQLLSCAAHLWLQRKNVGFRIPKLKSVYSTTNLR